MIIAIVVTYNRRKLLERCLTAIANQHIRPDLTIVLDNASSDGTSSWLKTWMPTHLPCGEIKLLTQNSGGAGGFAEGLRSSLEKGSEWTWMMDDDAEPHPNALSELVKVAKDPANIYGSLATKGAVTSWTTTLLDPCPHVIDNAEDVPDSARVQSLPFLGFFIHRDLVKRIGYPDAGYFIAADDIEYCIRAEQAGAQIIVAGRSLIEHPKSERYEAKVLGHHLICLRLTPWKRYYDTRNRLLIARKYYGIRLVTKTIPGSFVRLYAALRHEPLKLAQLGAFCAGMVDGLLGIKGRRHVWWRIRQ